MLTNYFDKKKRIESKKIKQMESMGPRFPWKDFFLKITLLKNRHSALHLHKTATIR